MSYCRDGVLIIPDSVSDLVSYNSRAGYPAIGDFVDSGAIEEISYTVICSKFNKLGPLKTPKMLKASDLTRVMVSLPMQEGKRFLDCGSIRASGQYKVTLDYDMEGHGYGARVKYNRFSCHCYSCSECGESHILRIAWETAQDIQARVLGLKLCGVDHPHVYEWVFSPPQGTLEEYRETVRKSQYKEGLADFEAMISFIIR